MSATTNNPRYRFGRLIIDEYAAQNLPLMELLRLNKYLDNAPEKFLYMYENRLFVVEKANGRGIISLPY